MNSIFDNLNSGHTQSFTYDALNRIASGSQADSAWSQTYSIDPWGNMNQYGTNNFAQAFDVHNRISTGGYGYDAAGDLTYDTFHTYAYDAEGRIKSVDSTAATYTYDPDGQRVRKDASGASTEYLYLGSNVIAEKNVSTGAWTDYIFGNSGRIARATGSTSSGTVYYHADHLGTTRIETDASANVISNCTYEPFGEEMNCSLSDAANHYKFTGKERDQESSPIAGGPNGLDYFGARYNANTMGRWMSPDWSAGPTGVPYADFSNPQSLNLYSYVGNNPLSRADPDGHCSADNGKHGSVWCALHAIGFVLSGAEKKAEAEAKRKAEEAAIQRRSAWQKAHPGQSYEWHMFNWSMGIMPMAGFGVIGEGGELLEEGEAAADGVANANKLHHIFGRAKHGLGMLVSKLGSEQAAYNALQGATEAAVRAQGMAGEFTVSVQVAGETVTVTGKVVDGAVRIGTAYKPWGN